MIKATTMSINLIPIKGTNTPPSPYINKFLRSSALAPIGLYATPFSANGISNGIIIALNIIADKIALSGLYNCMIFRLCKEGIATINKAGIIAKYFATSFAILNVVSTSGH